MYFFFFSNERYVTAHYWDFEESSLLVCETKTLDQEENTPVMKASDIVTSEDSLSKNATVRMIAVRTSRSKV